MVRRERHGYSQELVASGVNRAVNLSAQVLWGTHSKVFLSRFPVMVIPQSWVVEAKMPALELHGFTPERGMFGHNREVNLWGLVPWGTQGKAGLSLFP